MALLFKDLGRRVELLDKKSTAIANHIEDLMYEIERDEKLLDAYSHPGWELIAAKVLESEINHIARKAIKVDAEDMPNRYRAEGAYDKVSDLFRRKDILQASIDDMRAELSKLREEQAEIQSKLTKLQE